MKGNRRQAVPISDENHYKKTVGGDIHPDPELCPPRTNCNSENLFCCYYLSHWFHMESDMHALVNSSSSLLPTESGTSVSVFPLEKIFPKF